MTTVLRGTGSPSFLLAPEHQSELLFAVEFPPSCSSPLGSNLPLYCTRRAAAGRECLHDLRQGAKSKRRIEEQERVTKLPSLR